MSYQGKRITHQFVQTNCASPEKVFPLLCPVREGEWVPGWQYRMVYSHSGIAENGCVFITPNEDGSETTWVVTEYDPAAFRIAFAWINPGFVAAQLRIRLCANSPQETAAHISYTYTGLSEKGDGEVQRYDATWFEHKMKHWEMAINHYLRSGRKIDAATWE
jgi:hypothetical protein